MGRRLERIERAVLGFTNGSKHPSFRQPLWRTFPDLSSADVSLSHYYREDREASKWWSRSWKKVGVLSVKAAAWRSMVEAHPNSRPALVRELAQNEGLVIGCLESHSDLGKVRYKGGLHPGHGLRIGPDTMQFGLGLLTEAGTFIPPRDSDVIHLGTVPISMISDPDSDYGYLNFS